MRKARINQKPQQKTHPSRKEEDLKTDGSSECNSHDRLVYRVWKIDPCPTLFPDHSVDDEMDKLIGLAQSKGTAGIVSTIGQTFE